MKLTVVWHKPCWRSADSPTGFAVRGHPGLGGLAFQVDVLSQLFDATRVIGPTARPGDRSGETAISGRNVSVVPLSPLPRSSWSGWPALPIWLARNGLTLVREIARADAVLAIIPSPPGVLGLVLALVYRKRLLTRQLNYWCDRRLLWRLERALLERIAGGRNVVFATGDSEEPPSRRNPSIRWLASTALSERELVDLPPPRDLPPESRARLLLLGWEVEPKGTRLLLRALRLISDRFPAVTLDVVGDGPALSQCKRLARELAVSDRVTFHGALSREQVTALLGEADLLCLPGEEMEGFRHSLHQALAAGLPVVATRCAVAPAMLRGSGIIVDPETPEAFAACVGACLADPARYHSMSVEALRIARRYSLERWRESIRAAVEEAWGPLRASP